MAGLWLPDLERQSAEEWRQLVGQIGAEDQRLALEMRERQRQAKLAHAVQAKAAARFHCSLLHLRVHTLRVALQLRELPVGVEVAGLLHLLGSLAQ